MIKTFILIFYIASGIASHGGPSTAEFQSLEKCEDAVVQLKEYWGNAFRGGVCVEK